ncbi:MULTISPECIES: substrate-binding domain-containing protein [Halolamina]|uniref:Tungstate transport system substrate-binding protein n=1 Tax=Halolamina pelagica TaxID=699431 RepID=A0A1I5S0C1_9EURY|nr:MULTISPECIES: substrate-binding domain-containing protein [Halolamina]NHX35434.1 molybdenum transporter [Halolamina sp. R1-12]SFP64170.1 tungstate transport system substrate-binding protein [Halolamina pelagica]
MDRRGYLRAVGVGGALTLAGCGGETGAVNAEGFDGAGTLTLATATTAYDSGLLDALVPGFEAAFGATVRTLPRGTGGSLETARNGDCDAVLVHARPLEDAFLRSGHGVNRRALMVNDFLVVGPADDPAGVAGLDPLPAFRAIADAGAPFVSRGDRSGTHIREQQIWERAGVEPGGDWYRETGQGMGNTLTTAEQMGAYTLTDRGTFLTVREGSLTSHVDRGIEDPPSLLRNEYAVIPTNPARHEVAYPPAMALLGYLTGPCRSRIAEFRVDGDRAFRPLGATEDPNFDQYVPRDWEG